MADSLYSTTLLWFTAGFILQAILPLRNKANLIGFLLLVIVVLVPSYIVSTDNFEIYPRAFIFTFLVFFFPTYFLAFKSYVLPNINELTLMLYTIFFWYSTLTLTESVGKSFLINIAAFPTLLTLIFALFPKQLSVFWQLLAYLWFLVLTSVLFLFQFNTKPLSFLLGDQTAISSSNTEIFLSGMVFFILAIKITSLLYLLPLPLKNQSFSNRIDNIKKYIHLLAIKFRDTQLIPYQALIIISGVSLILWINYQYKFISDTILINSLIILIPFLTHEYEKPAVRPK